MDDVTVAIKKATGLALRPWPDFGEFGELAAKNHRLSTPVAGLAVIG